MAAGVLAGLGIYADLAGAAGRGVDGIAGGSLGVARYLVPPALLIAGILLVRTDPDDEERSGGFPVRGVIGSILLLIVGTGMLHLFLGRPAFGDGLDALADAGGVAGAATGVPLEATASVYGAALVLGTITVIALLVLTKTTVRSLAGSTAAGIRPLGHVTRQTMATMMSSPGKDGEAETSSTDVADAPSESRRPRGWGSDSGDDAAEADATTLDLTDEAPTMVVGGKSVDAAGPFDQDAAALAAAAGPTKATTPPDPDVDPEQLHIDLGPAATTASAWKLPKLDLPPGSYGIHVTLIDAVTKAPQNIIAEDGHYIDDHLLLSRIRVQQITE
jgi:hypothetical protein